jgi:hypothetical protein
MNYLEAQCNKQNKIKSSGVVLLARAIKNSNNISTGVQTDQLTQINFQAISLQASAKDRVLDVMQPP